MRHRRHPLQVTADRLGDHYQRHYDRLSEDSDALDEISHLRFVLETIADEIRYGSEDY